MNILDQILEYKKEFVEKSRQVLSLDKLRASLDPASVIRPFAAALRGTRDANGRRELQATLRVIAEIKKASPSKGMIREDFDPAAIARAYEGGGASALSVLTDERFFMGSLDALVRARRASTLPILRKEFLIDPYQLYEARAAGADAVLLIVGLIPLAQLTDLRQGARELGLEVLVEIHNEREIEDALTLQPDALGINNRDLRSAEFRTDISRTEELIDRIPAAQTLISESGIRDRGDVARLTSLGVDGVLVGEHLMRERNPGEAISRKLGLGRPWIQPAEMR